MRRVGIEWKVGVEVETAFRYETILIRIASVTSVYYIKELYPGFGNMWRWDLAMHFD